MRTTFATVIMVFTATTVACGSEIEGFRLGMSMDTVKQLVAEKRYALSNGIKISDRWVSYLLLKDGPSLSFCDSTLSAVSAQRASNFHEITSLLRDWRNTLGEPEIVADPKYVQGVQFSTIEFKWPGQDNIRRNITVSQFGPAQLNIGFGYAYIINPCQIAR